MDSISYANTPEGKAQSKRLIECRLELGYNSAKEFYDNESKGRFSYPQYQKYESGERLLSRKAAILYAQIFKKDWEWLQYGKQAEKAIAHEDFSNLSEEEKNLIRNFRKSHTANNSTTSEKQVS